MYGNFFPNLRSIISEKCVVTPNFLFGFWYPLLRSTFSTYRLKLRKNIVVLVGEFLKRPKYPGMCRTYAQ